MEDMEVHFFHKLASCNGDLHKENEALRIQIGQMAEESKAQKALEKEHVQTIGQLRAVVAQQTKEVSAQIRYIILFY
jgi:hypothetical protein